MIGGGKTIIANTDFHLADDNSRIVIGNDFTMESGHIAATEGATINIGNDCMFSNDVEIRNGDSHSILDASSGKRINHAQNVNIGNHVWLGAHSRILKGSIIPDNCIIGNSALVSGKLSEENTAYGGIPAKSLKSNINWSRQR